MEYLVAVHQKSFDVLQISRDSSRTLHSAVWTSTDDLAVALKTFFASQSKPKRIVFGLGSELCLPCQFELPAVGVRTKPEVLRFAAEQFLPLSAEDFAATISIFDDRVFCVACERRLVESLHSTFHGSMVVVPLALMFAKLKAGRSKSETGQELTFAFAGRLESVTWNNGPQGWSSTEVCSEEGVAPNKAGLSASVDSADLSGMVSELGLPPNASVADINFLADPTLGLAGDSPGEASLQRLCQIVVLASIVVVFAMLFRRNRIYELTAEVEDSQVQLFRTVYSEGKPQGITRKLKSEVARRTAFANEHSEWQQQNPSTGPAFVAAIQTCLSVKQLALTKLEASGPTAKLEVTCRDKKQATSLAESLKEAGLVVEPPDIRPRGQMFSATIVAVDVETSK